MTLTDSLPEPTFTKCITSMTVPELQQTCLFFKLPQTGITPTLWTCLKTYLLNHKHELQHDYDYTALYPNRDLIVQVRQPRQASQGSQAYSHWNGIDNQNIIPQAASVHSASLAPVASNHIEEYLQGKFKIHSSKPHILPSLPSSS